jgi:hypothetical protein
MARQELVRKDTKSMSAALSENTAIALGVLREAMALKPNPKRSDYAKIHSIRVTAALGVLAIKVKLDREALRNTHDSERIEQILDRIKKYDAGSRAAAREPTASTIDALTSEEISDEED